MRIDPPDLDRPAEHWNERDLRVEKLRIDWARFQNENAPTRRYGPIILSALLSAAAAGGTWWLDMRSEQRAEMTLARQWQISQSAGALRLYFERPDLFAGEDGAVNLWLLEQTTPPETMQSIRGAATARAERARELASQAAASAASSASDPQTQRASADAARYATLANAPSVARTTAQSAPSDFTIFIQYGTGAADDAEAARAELERAGYSAPPTDWEALGPPSAEVRYFRASQRGAAEALGNAIAASGAERPRIMLVDNASLPDGILELWLPANEESIAVSDARREPAGPTP